MNEKTATLEDIPEVEQGLDLQTLRGNFDSLQGDLKKHPTLQYVSYPIQIIFRKVNELIVKKETSRDESEVNRLNDLTKGITNVLSRIILDIQEVLNKYQISKEPLTDTELLKIKTDILYIERRLKSERFRFTNAAQRVLILDM